MKIRLLSDLHSEHWNENLPAAKKRMEKILPPLPDDPKTILVLAGDICSAKRKAMLRTVLEHCSKRFSAVYYIPGNHEAYGCELITASLDIAEICGEFRNVHYGSPKRTPLSSHFFLGCILWTDFDDVNPVTMYNAQRGMNDYRLIQMGNQGPLTPDATLSMHKDMRRALEREIQEGDIVVTHHAPSSKSLHPNYDGHPLNGCYYSNLEEVILDRKPALWMHGHVHYGQDYTIGKTRIICNPSGYKNETGVGYLPDLVIEL